MIKVVVEDENFHRTTHTYLDSQGEPATVMMTALNKADLTVNSLQKRILEQLVSDGKLAPGTVTGTPD